MEKMKMQTVDGIARNIEKLEELFPNCVTETRGEDGAIKKAINFDVLRQLLSGEITESPETYDFTWVGKKAALAEAHKPIRKTLRPCPEESRNWDSTQNIYIEGDNLEVLKLLQESYLGKVKMIYIDPPYNTGSDSFVYNDNFRANDEEYDEEAELFDEEGNKVFRENNASNPRFHSDWCSMIYSRLILARTLLADDGVIFISIDDNESGNLRKCCDEIFGASNFVAQCSVQKSTNGMGDKKGFAKNHEFIYCYQKSELTSFTGLSPSKEYLELFDKKDEFGHYKIDGILMKKGAGSRRIDSPTLFFPLYYSSETGKVSLENQSGFRERLPYKSDGSEGRWTWSKVKVRNESHRLFASPNGTIYIKDYLTDDRRMKIKTILSDVTYINDRATNEIKQLFCEKIFDTPKPTKLLYDLVDMSTNVGDIILDFFSGSATTAHAVMQLNKEDGKRRHFVMVQLPEACDEKSEAYKSGYKNICEIGKERIRRAGDKIKNENPLTTAGLDVGFRVFKVDDSNMKDVYYGCDDLTQELLASTESNIKADRTDLDLLFSCVLEWGLPLSMPYKTEQIDGFTVHTYNDGDLIACFQEGATEKLIIEIARRNPLRAVFRDSCFSNVASKINLGEIFKRFAPDAKIKTL